MKLRGSRAYLVAVILLFAPVSVGFYENSIGTRPAPPQVASEEAETEFTESFGRFRQVLDVLVSNSAAGEVEETAIYGGIDGMLRTLDPHSRFYRPNEFRDLREQQTGTYSGLGISVSGRFGRVTIASPPFPATPAEKVGLRVGDVISHVNGESIEGFPLGDVVSLLKGPAGTAVEIRVVRPGVDVPLDLRIVRDEISRYTVSNVFRLRSDIAYVKVENFAETTTDELLGALDALDQSAITGLILDLRNNPGGLMQQAITVSELFLERGQRILEIRGRNFEHTYVSEQSNTEHQYPLIVLINRRSASASEIVAGAVQDHDRGLIVGETSFGKGLVQSVYALRGDFGLALTTQKWYTPSGRLIQRDYSQISDFDYYNQPELTITPTEDDIYYSDLGRKVYGGGGVIPDEKVRPRPLTPAQDLLSRSIVFYTFYEKYLAGRSSPTARFQVTDDIFNDFATHVQERGIPLSPTELEANRDFVSNWIRYEVTYNRFGVSEAARVQLEADEQVLRAIELMPEAADLFARAANRTEGAP
jgi:carboxyl-terminal processing protease